MNIVRTVALLALLALMGGLASVAHAQTARDGYVAPGVRVPTPRIWRVDPDTVSVSDFDDGPPKIVGAAFAPPPVPGISYAEAVANDRNAKTTRANIPVIAVGPPNIQISEPTETESNYYAPITPPRKKSPESSPDVEPRVLGAVPTSKHAASVKQDPPPPTLPPTTPSSGNASNSAAGSAAAGSSAACACNTDCATGNACAAGGCNQNCGQQDNGCQCDQCKNCRHRRGCWCELECPEQKEPCKLFDCCCLKECNLDIGGYVEMGYTYNFYQPNDHWNGTVGFNDRDEFQGNQLGLHFEKATKPDDCHCDWGGRIDVIYGTDARWFQALGLETHDNGTNKWNSERFYQLALPQFYASLASEKAAIKVGKFFTPFEYEVIDPTGNFFYSHTYGFLYAGPFTQTGAWATFTLDDNWTLGGGVDRGWDKFDDDNGTPGYFVTLNWASNDKNSSLVLTALTGKEFGTTGIDAPRTAVSAAWTQKFNPRFTYVIAGDYGIQQQGADGGASDAEWYGIEQYMLYQMCCNWWFGVRLEWFRDDDGTRVFPVGDGGTQPINSNPASVGGFAGNFYEVAVGLNYKPTANLFIRPEVRYDRFDGVALNGAQPFDDGTRDTQVLAACDLIVKF